LYNPNDVAVDSAGNLFISDLNNSRIRKVGLSAELLVLNNITNDQLGTYQVIITGAGGSITSSVASLFGPPYVASNPQSQSVWAGRAAIFSVGAGGSASFNYQWQLNGTNLTEATNAVYSIATAATNQAGNYSVMITSPYGTVSSVNASLAVNYLSQQPQNQWQTNGGTATFIVGVAGSDAFTYQWLFNGTNLIGANQPTLAIPNVSGANVGIYAAVVSLSSGSITSSVAALNLVYPPSIGQPPQNRNVPSGGNVQFSVSANGTSPFGYQWFTVAGSQSNATATPIVINGFVLGANMVSGGAGYLAAPNIQMIGGNGSGASGFAVVSNGQVSAVNIINPGFGYTTPPFIQIDAPSAVSLSGQTNATLTLLAVNSSTAPNYFVVVTNDFASVTSGLAALTVFLPPQSFSGLMVGGKQLGLRFSGTPNYSYVLQSATNLTPPVSWQSIRTNNADVNGNWLFTETNLNAVQKFYRAVGQ
jgi:hypothetical protein